MVEGHAADRHLPADRARGGAAAALAAEDKCRPRDVDIPRLRSLLVSQGAYLG